MSEQKESTALGRALRKRRDRKKHGRKRNPTGEMTLVEHLKELRRRVIVSVIAVLLASVVGYVWYEVSLFGLPTLGQLLRDPYCALPDHLRADFIGDGECRLLATNPFEMFILRLQVGTLAGVVLSSPVWLAQIWGFITPGLHKNERRYTLLFVSIAVALFVLGAGLAYYVMQYGLEFLLGIAQGNQVAALTGKEYFGFFLTLIIVFGVSFEVPLIIIMLNIVGILGYDAINNKRRIIWVVLFIFAALMTPGGDPFSMVILGIALCLLVEIAFQFCRINDKRRGYDKLVSDDLDDEQASELDYRPEPVSAATPIERPAAPQRRSNVPPKPQKPATPDYFDDVL